MGDPKSLPRLLHNAIFPLAHSYRSFGQCCASGSYPSQRPLSMGRPPAVSPGRSHARHQRPADRPHLHRPLRRGRGSEPRRVDHLGKVGAAQREARARRLARPQRDALEAPARVAAASSGDAPHRVLTMVRHNLVRAPGICSARPLPSDAGATAQGQLTSNAAGFGFEAGVRPGHR